MNSIELAKQAGVSIRGHYDETGSTLQELTRFAALVHNEALEKAELALHRNADKTLEEIAAAIRALKEQT